jgi:pimeloyl-ACP methyl ester carboxylesterase
MALNHVRRGSGEPLLLVHGTGSRWEMWAPVLDALAARYEVIAPDLPGFGGSPPQPGPTTLQSLADALEGFLAEVGIERPHVAGNSLGGRLALELAQRGAVRSAVPISPSGFGTRRERAFMGATLRATRQLAKLLAPRANAVMAPLPARAVLLSQVIGRPWRVPAAEAAHTIRGLAQASRAFEEILAWQERNTYVPQPIEVPVTIAWGTRDWLLLPRQAPRAQRLVDGARLVMLPACGHVPTWDDPALVTQVIVDGVGRAAYAASHLASR